MESPGTLIPGPGGISCISCFSGKTRKSNDPKATSCDRPHLSSIAGGGGDSGFTFYDISNPRSPVAAFSTLDSADYSTEAGANFVGDMREPHGYTFSGNIACLTMNDAPGNKSGLQFWDFSDVDGSIPGAPDGPVRLSEISLGSLTGGDYDNTAWWVAWQGGRYAYVAETNAGLFIIDATDPSNPVMRKRITTGNLGSFRINTVHVIGNLLVVTNGNNSNGIATFYIGDPLNPQALSVKTRFISPDEAGNVFEVDTASLSATAAPPVGLQISPNRYLVK